MREIYCEIQETLVIKTVKWSLVKKKRKKKKLIFPITISYTQLLFTPIIYDILMLKIKILLLIKSTDFAIQ